MSEGSKTSISRSSSTVPLPPHQRTGSRPAAPSRRRARTCPAARRACRPCPCADGSCHGRHSLDRSHSSSCTARTRPAGGSDRLPRSARRFVEAELEPRRPRPRAPRLREGPGPEVHQVGERARRRRRPAAGDRNGRRGSSPAVRARRTPRRARGTSAPHLERWRRPGGTFAPGPGNGALDRGRSRSPGDAERLVVVARRGSLTGVFFHGRGPAETGRRLAVLSTNVRTASCRRPGLGVGGLWAGGSIQGAGFPQVPSVSLPVSVSISVPSLPLPPPPPPPRQPPPPGAATTAATTAVAAGAASTCEPSACAD